MEAQGHNMFKVGDIVRLTQKDYTDLITRTSRYAMPDVYERIEKLRAGIRINSILYYGGLKYADFKEIGSCPFDLLELVEQDTPKNELDYYSWLARRHGT